MKKYAVDTFPAYRLTVKMEGDLQTYAMNFLSIFNNVKTNPELYQITNDYKDNVYVVCEKSLVEATKRFLSQYGEITDIEEVLCASIEDDIEYDWDKYGDLVILPWQS